MAKLNLLCVQFDIAWEDKAINHDKVSKMLATANPQAGSLIVLPEMFETGFSMDVEKTAEDNERSGSTFLSKLAIKHRSWVIAGLVTKNGSKGANRLLVFDEQGNERCSYDKMHLFSPANENQFFVPGTETVQIELGGFTVSPVICYDLRFPELFRKGAALGTELFVVIANWPSKRIAHWCTLLQARAIENQAYVIGVNRSGTDPLNTYPGRTQVIDPRGTVLADADDKEQILHCTIDKESLLSYREEFPALKDMRMDLVI